MATTLTRRPGYRYGQFGSSSPIFVTSLATAPPVASGTTILTCPILTATTAYSSVALASYIALSPTIVSGSLTSASAQLQTVSSQTLVVPTLGCSITTTTVTLSIGSVVYVPPTLLSSLASTSTLLTVAGCTTLVPTVAGSLDQSSCALATAPLAVSATVVTGSLLTHSTPLLANKVFATDVLSADLYSHSVSLSIGTITLTVSSHTATLAAVTTDVASLLALQPSVLQAASATSDLTLTSTIGLTVPLYSGGLLSTTVLLASGAVVCAPGTLSSTLNAADVVVSPGELAIIVPSLASSLDSTTAEITGVLAISPLAVVGAADCTPAALLTGGATCVVGVLAIRVATAVVTVLPGNVLLSPLVVSSSLASDTLIILPSPVTFTASVLQAMLSSATAGIHMRWVLLPTTLTAMTEITPVSIIATLSLPVSDTAVTLQTTSVSIVAVLALGVTELSAACTAVTVNAEPGEVVLTVDALTASLVSLSVVIVSGYYGLYADTPFIATTGSMFE